MRLRLRLAYDGTRFHGFARQTGAIRTVQAELERALATVLGMPVETVCAGRTDAGVHAAGQVVSFELEGATPPPLDALARSLTGILWPEVVVAEAQLAAPHFDARHSARSRTYRYVVMNRPAPDPLLRHCAWHVEEQLDLGAMNAAAGHLVGEHDFASFCRAAPNRTTVRNVAEATWTDLEDGVLRFQITANAFCHQMVRSIVGLLVEVGRGRRGPGDVPGVLAARDRSRAAQLAPPHGLILWTVCYAEDVGTA